MSQTAHLTTLTRHCVGFLPTIRGNEQTNMIFITKGDISNELTMGTFLTSLDKYVIFPLTPCNL